MSTSRGYPLFTPSTLKGNGRCSSVSIFTIPGSDPKKTVVVSVRDVSFQTKLYYSVGIVDDKTGTTEWGPGDTGIKEYGVGQRPSVGLAWIEKCLYAVECHAAVFSRVCYCRVGLVNLEEKSITWGEVVMFSDGKKPRLSTTSDGRVVIILEEPCTFDVLKCFAGTIEPDSLTIKFPPRKGVVIDDFCGVEPDIAINDKRQIIAIYRSTNGILKTKLAMLAEDRDTITWSLSEYVLGGTGKNPSISLDLRGNIIEVHQTRFLKKLVTSSGYISGGSKIVWAAEKLLGHGEYPAISLSDLEDVFVMHASPWWLSVYHSQGKFQIPD